MIPRFERSQIGRTLVHPKLSTSIDLDPASVDGSGGTSNAGDSSNKNNVNVERNRSNSNGVKDCNDDCDGRELTDAAATAPNLHRFVICADTQYGMITDNEDWETELEYSRSAVRFMNGMNPRPVFCCVCGDLTDMDRSFEVKKPNSKFSMEECDEIQLRQREDFKTVWGELHRDIALVCLCGNHDVGNKPTARSMELYRKEFGDDYLAFWSSPKIYNIFLNTTLFSDPSGDETTEQMSRDQFRWLEERLRSVRMAAPNQNQLVASQPATTKDDATIFVFGHHPWFLYDEDEDPETMTGSCEWKSTIIPDSYFVIPKETRRLVLQLFREYRVAASFSGHFHQNLVSETSFGMKMIVTGPLSAMLESSGKKKLREDADKRGGDIAKLTIDEPDTLGLRLVEVSEDGSFRHEYISI